MEKETINCLPSLHSRSYLSIDLFTGRLIEIAVHTDRFPAPIEQLNFGSGEFGFLTQKVQFSPGPNTVAVSLCRQSDGTKRQNGRAKPISTGQLKWLKVELSGKQIRQMNLRV